MLKLSEFASTKGPVAQAFQPVLTMPFLVDIGPACGVEIPPAPLFQRGLQGDLTFTVKPAAALNQVNLSEALPLSILS
jgi:hypothetical protein